MALVGIVLVAALALGRLLGGRLRRLGGLPLAGWPLVAGAAIALAGGAGLAAATGTGLPYVAGALLATAAAAAFLVRNRGLPGVPLVALGLAGNAAVVAANGAMPVSAGAAAAAGVATGPLLAGADPGHVLLGAGTALPALADRIPLPLPVGAAVLSPGDVLVAAGLGLLVVAGMTGRYDAALRRAGR